MPESDAKQEFTTTTQFSQSLFLCEIFHGSYFHLPPTSLKILWNFRCVLYRSDHLPCILLLLSHGCHGEMRAVILKLYHMSVEWHHDVGKPTPQTRYIEPVLV